jgi:tetratricopeptide (TPR) repeat protein
MTTPVRTGSGWQRVRKLFHSALARDAAARADYLDQACGGAAELRQEVDSLIAADKQVDSFIAEPVGTSLKPPRAEPGRLPVGSSLGSYRLAEMLGAGGMGEVYRARDPRLDRDVALKVLPPDLAQKPERRDRFIREARMVSTLNHPNICTIYEIGSGNGLDYITLEYIEGQTLAALLEGPALSLDRILGLGLPLAEAVAYAHEKGILHRDLKPANIMVSDRGPKILDFGLAKVLAVGESGSGSSLSLTDSGLVIGTAAYMSPEQALGRKVDERSDVFSLGAVLYEMACAKQAFVGSTPSEVLDAVLHQEPVPLPRVRPELPTGLSLVVQKALRKDPSDRYQHVADLAGDLRRLARGEQTLVARRRHRVLAARAAMTVAVAALVGVLWARWHAAPPSAAPNSIAVMYFENLSDRTDADNLGRMLTGLVTTDLATSDGLTVVSSQRLFDIARQLGTTAGTPDRTVATQVARRAGAAKMVLGQVARAGPRTMATVELVEVAGGRLLGSYRVEATSSDDIFAMAAGLGTQVRAYLTGRPHTPGGAGSLTRQLTASAEAYRAYVRGEAFRHRDDPQKAAQEFRHAVQLDPEFALAHYRLSDAASAGGHTGPEARAAAQRAAALKHKLPAQLRGLVEGNALFVMGRLSHAIAVFELALARDPDNKELLYRLSDCYMHSPKDLDLRRAATLMERLLALDPDFHAVYNHLGLAYEDLGELATLRQKLDDWERKEPLTARMLRSRLSAAQGDLDEALRLSEGLGIDVFRNRQALAAGRWEIVRPLLEKNRSDPDMRPVEAHLDVHLGEFRQAEAIYRESLPDRLEASEYIGASWTAAILHSLAELLALRGELKAAYREAERALIIQPEGPYCLYVAGRFAVRAADIAAAERHLRALEELTRVARNPLLPHYRDGLAAEIALARGHPRAAQPLLETAVGSGRLRYEALQHFTPGPLFREALSRAYMADGDKKKAAEVLESVLAEKMEAVNHPVVYVLAHYTLGTLKLDLGDRARGRALLQMFLTRWGKADWDLPEVRDARARLASSR